MVLSNVQQVYEKFKEEVNNGDKNLVQKNGDIVLAKGKLFYEILEKAPPHLIQKMAKVPLESIYDVGYHRKTEFMFICNKGAYLIAKTSNSDKYYATVHIGFFIYAPNH